MKSVIRFIVGLLMPIILIGIGGGIGGLGVVNEWPVLAFIGLAFIGAGVLWGIFIFLWASEGPL
jgi:hypothetical protein